MSTMIHIHEVTSVTVGPVIRLGQKDRICFTRDIIIECGDGGTRFNISLFADSQTDLLDRFPIAAGEERATAEKRLEAAQEVQRDG